MNYQRELLKGNTDTLLLSLIIQKPIYGYQIIKEMETKSNGYFQFKEGTLYPALHRLEKAGFIKGKWEKLPSGQERRYYHIQEKGEKALEDRLKTWRSFSMAVNMVMHPVASI